MTADTARVAATFAALGDPTRQAIIARLRTGEASVRELAEPFAMTAQAVSQHLKILEAAGLVSRSRVAQSRPARLEPEALKSAWDWLDSYRQFWEESYDRLGEHLNRD
jgi:DNA-binding transcriptional ArsR family regulator